MSSEVEQYLPSLERARSLRCEVRTRLWRRTPVDVLSWTPAQVRPLAALLVRATPRRPTTQGDPVADPGISYAYVPDLPIALESAITRLLDPKGFTPPECLRYDPEGVEFVGGPYRGGPVHDPNFRGFRFAEVVPQVRAVLDGWVASQGGRDHVDVRAWAWPFLWITFRRYLASRDVILLVRPDLNLQAFVGAS